MLNEISVYLKNKPGELHKALVELGNHDVNIVACMSVETGEYSIVKFIWD